MFSKKTWRSAVVFCALLALGAAVTFAGSTTQTRSFKVKKGGQLIVEVENAGADIEIRVWSKAEVRVKVDGIPEDNLEDLAMSQSGNTVSVEYYGEGWRRARHVDFVINVPSEFDLDLATSGGDIEVDNNIKGNVEAATSGGDIDVRDVDGELELHTSGGDISAGRVTGDGELHTSGGDIEIGDVDGEVEAHTAGGDISVGRVGKDLDAKTAGGDISVGNIGGSAEVSTAGGDIDLGEVSGEAYLRTAGGDIVLKKASGRVTAQTAGGDIELENVTGTVAAETAGGDIFAELNPQGGRGSSLETAGGDIELYVPENVKVTIEARIRLRGHWHKDDEYHDDYEIYSDFKASTEDRNKRSITAVFVLNGGGPQISLETMNGDIHVMKLKKTTGSRSRSR